MEFLCSGLEVIDDLLKQKKYNALIQKLSGVYFYSSKSFEDRLDELEKVTGKIPRKTYLEFYKSL